MYHINKEITGSGENIALKNTAKHYFKNFDILGNRVQEGTPSINSEVPIESVGDNINLIDIDSLIEGYVKDGGECSTTSRYGEMRSGFLKVKPNTQYTFKIHETSGKEVSWMGIGEYSSNEISSYILRNVYSPSKYVENASYTITTSNTTQYVIVSSRNLIGATKIKFEEGQPTPYSPYGQGSIEVVNCNKNLLTKQPNVYYNPTGLTVTDKQIGEFILNGTQKANELRFFGPYNTKKCNYELPKGRYKFLAYVSNKDGAIYTELTISDGSSYQQINGIAIEFEITKEGQGLGSIKVPVGSGTYNEVELKMMLIKSTDDETYVPHQSQTKALYTQQPFRAIGDVKDRFVKQNSVWYEEHSIERLILNGTENWGKSSNTNNNIFYIQAIFNTLINKGMSNYFTYRIMWDID